MRKMFVMYAFNITQIEEKYIFDKLMCSISEERRERIYKFRFRDDKLRSLSAETIIRYALDDLYSLDLKKLQFGTSKYGKPYLIGNENVNFNISHSGEWMLCGLGEGPIGVDVERVRKSELVDLGFVFTSKESNYILRQPEEEQAMFFSRIWTLKESYVKRIGMGLQIPFDSFSFEISENKIQLFWQKRMVDDYYFWTGALDCEHYIAVCIDAKYEKLLDTNVRIVSLVDVMEWYYSRMENFADCN